MMKGSVRRINFHGYEQKSYLIGFNSSLNTSGFWPRVRARALCAPVFLNSLPRQTGAALRAPPTHRSFAASYSTPKNK
jgi:hypothetical protein